MVLGFRWRRDGWLVGSVVLAVLIVGAAVAYRSPSVWPPGTAGTSAAPGPDARPSALPDDGRFGLAELVYACVQGCRPVLVLADGREFEVPTDARFPRDITLSPDGRWLGYPLGTGYVLRDLVASAEHRMGSRGLDQRLVAWAWSADSSLLLLASAGDAGPTEFQLQNVRDGLSVQVTAWPGHEILGVRRPMDLLMTRPDATAGTKVDAALATGSGTVTSWFAVDGSAQLRPGELLVPSSLRFSGGAGYEVVVVRGGDNEPVALLRSTGATGATNRFDLTEPGPGRWSVLGVGDAGRAFVRNGQGRTEVWYLGPNGEFRADRTLPGDVMVVTPGTART